MESLISMDSTASMESMETMKAIVSHCALPVAAAAARVPASRAHGRGAARTDLVRVPTNAVA